MSTTRREQHRQATLEEIVRVARGLLAEPGGLSLRAVAQQMGMTAPALYRYVADYQGLVRLITHSIDAETAALIAAARDEHPADDPAAQIIAAAIAFRGWALSRPEEFSLVFANPLTRQSEHHAEDMAEEKTGRVFTDLLVQLWLKYDFPLPAESDLDPLVVQVLDDPVIPANVDALPSSARTLVWVFTQSWVALYGTVTLEVFGHCDPRIIESGALFVSMLLGQAERLGIVEEIPRLLPLIEKGLGR